MLIKSILKKENKIIIPFWFFTLSIVFGLTLPVLIQDAMFQDGVLYSCVSHNMSIGFGTFWFPQYSLLNLEGIPSFHEQPPLVFGIQSLFYRILGNSMYVERFYTFLMIVLHIFLINMLWKQIFSKNEAYKHHGWLAVLFWIIIPVCFWSFRHNMIENTVSIFTLCSISIIYKAFNNSKFNILLALLSGLFVFFASFSKGIPGLFPVSFPFIFWIITKKISFKQCCIYTAFLLLVPAVIYTIFIIHPVSRESLSIYFFDRLIMRVTSMPTADYRMEILWRLLNELIPILIITAIMVAFNKLKFKTHFHKHQQDFWLFFATGLSATLPLTLTMVQKGWYMVPSFPFFAIAFSILIISPVTFYINKIQLQHKLYRIILNISIILFLSVLTITISQKGKISRHRDILTDVYKIGKLVPRFSTLTVPAEMYYQYDFILQGFLVRYFNISISPYKQYEYFLKEKNMNPVMPPNYKKVEIDLSRYELYRNKGASSFELLE